MKTTIHYYILIIQLMLIGCNYEFSNVSEPPVSIYNVDANDENEQEIADEDLVSDAIYEEEETTDTGSDGDSTGSGGGGDTTGSETGATEEPTSTEPTPLPGFVDTTIYITITFQATADKSLQITWGETTATSNSSDYPRFQLVAKRNGVETVITSATSLNSNVVTFTQAQAVALMRSEFFVRFCHTDACDYYNTTFDSTATPVGTTVIAQVVGLDPENITNPTPTSKLITFSLETCTTCFKYIELTETRGDYSRVIYSESSESAIASMTTPILLSNFSAATYSIKGCVNHNDICYETSSNFSINLLNSSNVEIDPNSLIQRYFPAPGEGILAGGQLGGSLDLSKDGKTIVIGAAKSNLSKGKIFIYRFNDTTWDQEVIITPSNGQTGDRFGHSVSINQDGTLIAVGANGEDSNLSGINNEGVDNDLAINSGAVYIYRKAAGTWSLEAFIKSDFPGGDDSGTTANVEPPVPVNLNNGDGGTGGDQFGHVVSLSADGNYLAVASLSDDSSAEGIFTSQQSDNNAISIGAVHLYKYNNGSWSLQAFIKPSWNGEDLINDYYRNLPSKYFGYVFGGVLELDDDGNTLLVTAEKDDSVDIGIIHDKDSMSRALSNQSSWSGAAYIFSRENDTWVQEAYLKSSNPGNSDFYGRSAAISGDGKVVAIGAQQEDSDYTTVLNRNEIPTPETDNLNHTNSGAVYVYRKVDSMWIGDAFVKPPNNYTDSRFYQVTLNGDGSMLAVGASNENSFYEGINPIDPSTIDMSAVITTKVGGVYTFHFSTEWVFQDFIKHPTPRNSDLFGEVVRISGDGQTLLISCPLDEINDSGTQNEGAFLIY